MSNLIFIIDGKKADVSEDIDFTRIYRGIETKDTKKNNYSLTVKFPFTINNDLLFKRTNSLTYKSDFPYQTHTCDVLSTSGVILIPKANLVLLSTTDSYECAMTWEPSDLISNVIDNKNKLGVLLKDFPFVHWDYQKNIIDEIDYSDAKADTYGYIKYYHVTGDGSYIKFFSHMHPLINFFYLLESVFDALGISVNIPTIKEDYLKKLIIRPNKEYDIKTNNVFQASMKRKLDGSTIMNCLNFFYTIDSAPLPSAATFGRNSYYFKSWKDSIDGNDGVGVSYGDYDSIYQTERIKCFKTCANNEVIISNFVAFSPAVNVPQFVRYRPSDNTYLDLFLITGNGTHYFDAEEGDWFFIAVFDVGNKEFDIQITSPIFDEDSEPNPLYFPSLYHIPTNIDLTVGEFVREALKLTGSQLTYDINADLYSFSELTREIGSAFDITKYITSIKEISYDTKYVYGKLGQSNAFKYGDIIPINGNYYIGIENEKLAPEVVHLQSLFYTSLTVSGGDYDGFTSAPEHDYVSGQDWTSFSEMPLHILWNDTAADTVAYGSFNSMNYIFSSFWEAYFLDLQSVALSGTVRLLKVNTDISDIEFKRINTKGIVYIKTYGKYYGIIEIAKNGDFAEFFLLELY